MLLSHCSSYELKEVLTDVDTHVLGQSKNFKACKNFHKMSNWSRKYLTITVSFIIKVHRLEITQQTGFLSI